MNVPPSPCGLHVASDRLTIPISFLSFQELDLSAEAYIVLDGSREEEWTKAIADSLGTNYKKVMSKQLVGLLIVMFAVEDHFGYIKEVTTHSVGVGIMGILVSTGDHMPGNRFLYDFEIVEHSLTGSALFCVPTRPTKAVCPFESGTRIPTFALLDPTLRQTLVRLIVETRITRKSVVVSSSLLPTPMTSPRVQQEMLP